MLRIIAISLMLVLSVGIMLPFANEAHGVRQTTQVGQRRHHRYRSRAWWRRYRARLRQKRLAAELAHRNKMLSLPQNITVGDLSGLSQPALPSVPSNATTVTTTTPPPPVMTASVPASSNGATRPRVVNSAHSAFKAEAPKLPGSMNLAVVAMSRPNPAFLTSREEKKMLGGVAVADLRRMVIDKMVSSGGWVVNDFVREVNGHRVFVVTGRTPKDALTPEKMWMFYFTEAGGRIYGLTTDSPVEFADRMTTEAERFIESLRAKAGSTN
ncbi:MAG TPA: hypothetical protein VJ751_07880 [Pyrinomonadaceae bacterium]|nr:hypothetical protein [Pyrinomonadaceae bacterium]